MSQSVSTVSENVGFLLRGRRPILRVVLAVIRRLGVDGFESLADTGGQKASERRSVLVWRLLLVAHILIPAFVNALEKLPITAEELTEISEVMQPIVSPNGAFLSFMLVTPRIQPNETTIEVVVMDIATARIVSRVPNGSLIRTWDTYYGVDAPIWSLDSRYVYTRSLEESEIQIWRLDIETGRREQITTDAADVETFSMARDGQAINYWTRDGREEARHNAEKAARDGYLADDGLMLYTEVERNYWFEGRRASLRLQHGTLVDVSLGALRERRIDLRTRSVEELERGDPLPAKQYGVKAIRPFDQNAEGQMVVAHEQPDTPGRYDFATLQVVRGTDGGVLTECRAAACEGVLLSAHWVEDGCGIVFIKEDLTGAGRVVGEWYPLSGKVRQIGQYPGILEGKLPRRLTGSEGDCPIWRDDMFCVYEDANVSPRLVRINLHDGHSETIFNPNPALTAERLGRVETQSWRDRLGNHVFGKLVYPARYVPGRRYPLVMVTYSCRGFLRGGSGDEFPEFLFSAAGMFSVCINYNGALARSRDDNEVPAFERVGELYESIIRDLDSRGLIDVHHIGIGGLSLSSKFVAWELFHSTRFAAASLAAPSMPDPIWADWMSVARWNEVRGGYDLPASDDPADPKWIAVSPALNATSIGAAIMISAAEIEVRLGVQWYGALRRANVPLDLYVYPQEGHQIFAFPSHRAVIYRRNVDWFRFWLQSYEDPEPAKIEQYTRWRQMRDRARNQENGKG